MRLLQFSLVIAAILVSACLGVIETAGGWLSTSFHIDGANHLAIAETLWQGGDPRTRENFFILHKYPNLAHRIVAEIAHVCDIDLLRSMAATNGALVYVGCLLVAVRWALLIRRRLAAVSETSLLLGIGAAGLTTVFGLGSMVHHFQANYFFPHIFSTVLAMLLLLLLQLVSGCWARSGIFVTGVVLLTRMHLVGALWFILAALTFILGTSFHRRGFLHTVALGVGATVVGVLTPEVRNMVSIAEGNGGVILPLGNLTEQPALIAATIIGPLVLLAYHVVRRLQRGGREQLASILTEQAGLLAILTLAVVMIVALFAFGKGSAYGLAKLNYLLIIESIGLVFVFSPVVISQPDADGRLGKIRYLWLLALVGACFCMQRPWKYDAYFDQERLVFYRQNLLATKQKVVEAAERLYPQFNLPPWANLYLYMGVLQQGIDRESWEWYASGCTTGKPIGPELLQVRPLPADRTIRFDVPANYWRYTLSGWDNAERNGCWTHGSPARLMVSLEAGYRPRSLSVSALAFVPEPGEEIEVDVAVNGRRVDHWRFGYPGDFNFSNIPSRSLDLAQVVGVETKLVLVDFVIVRQTKSADKSLFVKQITFR